MLKKQIRNLSKQMDALTSGRTEKMLDISLIDKDLEQFAAILNQQLARQRYTAACAIRQEEHMKESIANISHDLRTPLTIIMGHLQMLLKSELTNEQRRRTETVLCKADRMKELIGVFYQLSILDSNQMQPKKESINFTNMLIDFVAEHAPLLETKKINPVIMLPDTSVYIQADCGMLERILQNLLTNAVCYSDGEIKIQLCQTKEHKAIFSIENKVVNEEDIDIDRLFDRFYTGDKSRQNESTGLGLAVVKLLVEKLDGQISAALQAGVLSIKIILLSCNEPEV